MSRSGLKLERMHDVLERQGRAHRRGRRLWDRRAHSWEHHSSVGLERVVEAVVEAAAPAPGQSVLDLGCGGGQLSIPLAQRGASVTAVDISPRMIEVLRTKAREAGVEVATSVGAVQDLALAPGSLDLVVSNYAMHHLRDPEKEAAVRAAVTWLRPGGRLVIGDMMFGRGASARDREILVTKARAMLGRGVAGWWRLAKNLVRFGLHVRERPLPMETWERLFVSAGLAEVRAVPVMVEAAVVSGTKPGSPGR